MKALRIVGCAFVALPILGILAFMGYHIYQAILVIPEELEIPLMILFGSIISMIIGVELIDISERKS